MDVFMRRAQGLLLASAITLMLISGTKPASANELSRQSRQLLILCTANGFIPYPGDVTKYIQCVWIGPRWYYYVYNCPPGSGFDTSRQLCVFGVANPPPTTTGAPTTVASTTSAAASTTAATTAASAMTTTAMGTTAAGATTPAMMTSPAGGMSTT